MHAASIATSLGAGLAGLPAGSYATVLAARMPGNQNVLRPLGRCPRCQVTLPPSQMVPVASWLLLHGRCATCGQRIGVRYPLTELGTAAIFAALGLQLGQSILLIPLCYLSAIGVTLALIDIEHRRLPYTLTIPSYLVVIAFLVLAAPFTASGWQHLAASLISMTALWLFYAFLAVWLPGRLGWGDVWLAGLLGLTLGWFGRSVFVAGALSGWLLALPLALWRMKARRHLRPTPVIALGPFMLAGALLAILASNVTT